MRRALGLLTAAVVAVSSVRCGGALSPTASDTTPAARAAAAWAMVKIGTSGGVASTAVIDGFRVHPDPGDDGVIHVLEGQNVVINATDIASRPPAPQSYLIVNWGEGSNQRVGCGPCRLEHAYGAGRYTLVATADDLLPATPAGASTNRSISLVVEVSTQREPKHSLFEAFGFVPSTLSVGDSGIIILPIPPPPGITITALPFPSCAPLGIFAIIGPPLVVPSGIGVPIIAIAPGTCTVTISGTDSGEAPFSESSTLTIQ